MQRDDSLVKEIRASEEKYNDRDTIAHLEFVYSIHPHLNRRAKAADGATPLIAATQKGRPAIVNWLLSKDHFWAPLVVDERDNAGQHALYYAVMYADDGENAPAPETRRRREILDALLATKKTPNIYKYVKHALRHDNYYFLRAAMRTYPPKGDNVIILNNGISAALRADFTKIQKVFSMPDVRAVMRKYMLGELCDHYVPVHIEATKALIECGVVNIDVRDYEKLMKQRKEYKITKETTVAVWDSLQRYLPFETVVKYFPDYVDFHQQLLAIEDPEARMQDFRSKYFGIM